MNYREEYLILIADGEEKARDEMSDYLSGVGYKTVLAHDGMQALELMSELKPHLAVLDSKIPRVDALEFLKIVSKNPAATPIIVTASSPDIATAIQAIQSGAFDYIVKPFAPEVLHKKIVAALQKTKTVRENTLLSELVSLHQITGKLTSTHDLEELLDVTFKFCLDISKAESGSIQLVHRDSNELVIARKRGISSPMLRSDLGDDTQWPLSKWVVKNGRSLLIARDRIIPDIDIALDREELGSALSVPLKVSEEVIGVVNCNRGKNAEPFSILDLNLIDMLASQASIAINNATLISSVNQKLDDLSLISTYSEQLMQLVDENDVIKCLFTTVHKHFPVDLVGFLIVQKRGHVFLYWSRYHLTEEEIGHACTRVVDEYNRITRGGVSRKRVAFRRLMPPSGQKKAPSAEVNFHHIVPIVGEAFDYGALYFGAPADFTRSQGRLALLSSLVSQTRIALTNSKLYNDMKENYIRTIKALAIAVDAKDTYTHGPSENGMNIAEELSHEVGLEARQIGNVRDAGLLHDIGKIGVPGNILNKAGTLTYEEFNGIMKTHSSLGANIVKDVPFLQNLYQLILYHHENFDGSGYPEGRKGEEIPIGARIIHVADAFEAMTSNRPYRTSLGKEEAIKRLNEGSGKQFDPTIIEAFMKLARRKGWLNGGQFD
jgi:response regulator RpfG family c-di-GMP phosphodiesterase